LQLATVQDNMALADAIGGQIRLYQSPFPIHALKLLKPNPSLKLPSTLTLVYKN
jgi:hypothetical protein